MQSNRGFTLVEMIVAVALFAVVMLISISALLSLITANRKAQAIQSVINNLNVTIDSMVRAIREGSDYSCSATPNTDCLTGSPSFYFTDFQGNDVVYTFDEGVILRRIGSGDLQELTAPEVEIEDVQFFVIGSARGGADNLQPKVLIVIKGRAGTLGTRTDTTFHIQSTAVQRVLDI